MVSPQQTSSSTWGVYAPQGVTLSQEQEQTTLEVAKFLADPPKASRWGCPLFRLGGYAGTGKTTTAKSIIRMADRLFDMSPAICAFTGKACAVLRNKGMGAAQTIHRTIYEYDPKREEFLLRPQLAGVDFILVDEGSMVNTSLWCDLAGYEKPIIVIGDPGQLEPVGDDPRLMHECDIVLQTIHRQAAESAIIRFADHVRRGYEIPRGTRGEVRITDKATFWELVAAEDFDHVLCGFNRTRTKVNRMIRARRYGKQVPPLVPGERIIVLRNDVKLQVFNGQILVVDEVVEDQGDRFIVNCEDEAGNPYFHLPVWRANFNCDEKLDTRRVRDVAIADYGYCTTVHKFQGSEADRVLVADEQCDVWDPVRWRYTAITRAAKELVYCI